MESLMSEMLILHQENDTIIRLHIDKISKDYYEITKGSSMNSRYEHYMLDDFYVDDFAVEGVTVVIANYSYCNQAGEESIAVEFPIEYLNNDDWQEPLRNEYILLRENEASRKQEAKQKLEEARKAKLLERRMSANKFFI